MPEDGLSSLAERVGAAGVEAGEHVLPHRVAVDAVHGGTIQTVDAIHGGGAEAARAVGIGRWQGEQGVPLHKRTDEERSGAKCCLRPTDVTREAGRMSIPDHQLQFLTLSIPPPAGNA